MKITLEEARAEEMARIPKFMAAPELFKMIFNEEAQVNTIINNRELSFSEKMDQIDNLIDELKKKRKDLQGM